MPVKTDIQTITGAQAIINTLKNLSVTTVFGYPGGCILDLYDELYKQSDINHILVRHEQSAVHCAEGYARQSGKCGFVIVTSGPGATNTITGINNAYLDGYPVIVLAGQNTSLDKKSYQHANILEMTKTCTKASFRISKASEIEDTIIKAYNIATEGKKGPVVIEMVKDIFTQNTCIQHHSESINTNFKEVTYRDEDILKVYEKIQNSEKPLIIAGGGINHSKASTELNEFINKYNIPVVCSMMGIGAYDKSSKNYYGMIGINGDNNANELVKQSDLIISLGCRFNDRITSQFEDDDIFSKLIQINIINEKPSLLFIQGDIKEILKRINSLPPFNKNFSDWHKLANKNKLLNSQIRKISNMMHGFEVLQKLNKFTKDKNVIFTSDVGQHQVLAIKHLDVNANQRIFVSGGSGTMGFGLPASIGCAIASPETCIVCITGDGSFQMSLNELALCKDLGLNIKVVILDNGYLGMVRQLQEKNFAGRYSQTKISNPDFVKLAQSYGIDGLKIQSSDEIEKALEQAFSVKGTFILDFVIESMEIV